MSVLGCFAYLCCLIKKSGLILKLSQNKKGLNDVTAAPFLVCFYTKNGEAVMSFRLFLFRDDFSKEVVLELKLPKNQLTKKCAHRFSFFNEKKMKKFA